MWTPKVGYFYKLLPGLILAFIAIIVVSLMSSDPDEHTPKKFDEVKQFVIIR